MSSFELNYDLMRNVPLYDFFSFAFVFNQYPMKMHISARWKRKEKKLFESTAHKSHINFIGINKYFLVHNFSCIFLVKHKRNIWTNKSILMDSTSIRCVFYSLTLAMIQNFYHFSLCYLRAQHERKNWINKREETKEERKVFLFCRFCQFNSIFTFSYQINTHIFPGE